MLSLARELTTAAERGDVAEVVRIAGSRHLIDSSNRATGQGSTRSSAP